MISNITNPVRILIPDHPELTRAACGAEEFLHVLRSTADPATYDPGVEMWQLPAEMTTTEPVNAWTTIFGNWARHLGDEQRSTALDVRYGNYQHMGLYVSTATRAQIDTLVAARALLIRAAEPDRPAVLADLADYLATVEEYEGLVDASYRTFRKLLAVVEVAIATTPIHADHRPAAEGVPVADTARLLARIDTTPAGEPVQLTDEDESAFRRLALDWHYAIYGDQATTSHALLATYVY
ncbi:hypothetical protein [Amycolatopsis anabasis]|uniref:hypothetical protein n=1 Tax=Amycolatopsis anabasis TaxID=1840409 RepID=UPI00131A65BB|nr:hypothetical protein [Amycolatopsis anabasis]